MPPLRMIACSRRTTGHPAPMEPETRRIRVVSLCVRKDSSEDRAVSRVNKAFWSTIHLFHTLVSMVTSAYLLMDTNRIAVAKEISYRLDKTVTGSRVLCGLVHVTDVVRVVLNLSRLVLLVFAYIVDNPVPFVCETPLIMSRLGRAWLSFREFEAQNTAELMKRHGLNEEPIPEKSQPMKVMDRIKEYKSMRRSRRKLMAELAKIIADEL